MSRAPGAAGERIREILDLALERPRAERPAYLAGLCAGDERLFSEATSLLEALERGGDVLDPPEAMSFVEAAPLTGLSFGHYRVGERLGAGGMGVVYAAQDTRLGRTVAVKALPAHMTSDPHRRARFEQEARVLAALNHPNIAAIYGVEDTARGPVLVLEYVPGESLSLRLARGSLPLEDALPIARQILRALEAAHAAGVVHRDLKPANIHVLPDGAVKVLDFGIAKLEPPPLVGSSPSSPDGSPAIVVTGPMGVLGTASYMSPEQARAKPVDRRTDLWAFGCVLYEMLTGRRAFEGETFTDTLAALLRAEPDWSRLPARTPGHVARLIRQCLAKDPEERLRDAGDARLGLESPDAPADADRAGAPARRGRRAPAVAFGAGALLVGLAWIALSTRGGAPTPRPHAPPRTVRLSVKLPPEASMIPLLAVSPDGGTLACATGGEESRRLLIRPLGSPDWVDLPGTGGAETPFFSPDGAWVGFVSGRQLKRVPVGGGGAEILVDQGVGGGGCAWASDGRIVFADRAGGLSLLEAAGGTPRVLARPEPPGWWLAHPEFVPGEDAVLFTACPPLSDSITPASTTFDGHIDVLRIAGGERHKVYDAACCPRISTGADGGGVPGAGTAPCHLMFWQSGSLLAAPFDPRELRVTGKAVPIARLAEHIEPIPIMRYAVARSADVLATIPGDVTYDAARLAWFEPPGRVSIIAKASPAVDTPRLSPDGTRIAFVNSPVGAGDLWMYDLTRGASVLLPGTHDSSHPLWTPDGRRIVFATTPVPGTTSIRSIPCDQSSAPETIWTSDSWSAYPGSFTPDGRTLLMTANPIIGDDKTKDLYAYDLQTREQRPIFPSRALRIWPRLSPAGTLLAYATQETGRLEVYLHRYPDLSEKTPVSIGRGSRPTWSPDGRTLYYQWSNSIFAVDIESAEPLRISRPRTVLERAPDMRFDVGRDGRILLPHPSGDWGVQDTIDVTVGWESLLGAR